MAHIAQFTAAETAFVLREPIRTVKKALDAGPVRPVLLRRAGASVRAIGWSDLFYLYAVRALRDELTPKARTEFYEALQQAPIDRRDEVPVRPISDIGQRSGGGSRTAHDGPRGACRDGRVSGRWRTRAERDGDRSLPDRRVARWAVRPIEQILEDYPSLSCKEIEAAQAYADAYPKAGRPYPRTSLKRALQGAGLEALDDA